MDAVRIYYDVREGGPRRGRRRPIRVLSARKNIAANGVPAPASITN